MKSYNPRQILCPVDMSELSDLALKYAYVGAHVFNGSLTVLHAMHVDTPRYLSRDLTARVLSELENAKSAVQKELEAHVRRILGSAVDALSVTYQVTDILPSDAILQTVDNNAMDLVVMGTHGYSGVKQWMLGSVTESVLHRSKAPVFTVRQNTNTFIDTTQSDALPRIRHILCPCNMTAAAAHALQLAASVAGRFNARLTALWSLESDTPGDAHQFMDWIKNTVDDEHPVTPIIREGEAAAQAIRLAKEISCDLIIISAHHQPFEQGTVVGRTTERVLRHAPVPALAVPYNCECLVSSAAR